MRRSEPRQSRRAKSNGAAAKLVFVEASRLWDLSIFVEIWESLVISAIRLRNKCVGTYLRERLSYELLRKFDNV